VSRGERSTTFPASTETRARHPSHVNSGALAWPQMRLGYGRAQHRFRRHPRHAPCLPPWRAALGVLRAEHLLLGIVLFTSSLITVCGAAWTGCQCLLPLWAVRSSRGRPVCLGFGITCALTGRR
jgi:hypothetical protein